MRTELSLECWEAGPCVPQRRLRSNRSRPGTGAAITHNKMVAGKRDDLILEERRRQAETAQLEAPATEPAE